MEQDDRPVSGWYLSNLNPSPSISSIPVRSSTGERFCANVVNLTRATAT